MKAGRYLGVHVSISGGMHKALVRGMELAVNTIQVFLKNSNQWEAKPYSSAEIDKFLASKGDKGIEHIFAHSGYLINLAGAGDMLEKSVRALSDEIRRAHQLGIGSVVIHPGSHLGAGLDEGINKIAGSMDRAFQDAGARDVKILLETTAGQGNAVGFKFEHLRRIIDLCTHRDRIDICLDTCHIFAAGYDISSKKGYMETMDEFDSIIGIDRLKLIHLNDSKKGCGSLVDRHEHIGLGMIGEKGMTHILHDSRLAHIPMVLETPKDDDGSDMKNLNAVRKLIK